ARGDRYGAEVLLAAFASRLFFRAAVRLCRTPLLAALSSARAASRWRATAVSASPSPTAAWTFLIDVLSALRTVVLRSWRLSFCLLRLICDLMFAMRITESTSGPIGPGLPG